MTILPSSRVYIFLAALVIFVMSVVVGNAGAQEKPFGNVVITEALIGNIEPGRYAFKVTVTTVAPSAQIPFHVHSFPGVRYMLEGALTIHWKDRGSQTYSAGSTYYEGPGENHPTSGMSATNPFDVPAKVLIIELAPVR